MEYPSPNPNNFNSPYAPMGLKEVAPKDTGAPVPTPRHYVDAQQRIYPAGPVSETLYETGQSINTAPRKRIGDRILEMGGDNGFESPFAYEKAVMKSIQDTAVERGIDLESQQGRQWYKQARAQHMADMPTRIAQSDKERYKFQDGGVWDTRKGEWREKPTSAIANEYLKNVNNYQSPEAGAGGAEAPLPAPKRAPAQLAATIPELANYNKQIDEERKSHKADVDEARVDALAKQLVKYATPLPTGRAATDPTLQAAQVRASELDPTFDASQYPVRQKLKQDFTSGKSAANIRSLNTAIGHLNTLSDKGNALGNEDVQLWNKISNATLSQTGDPRVTGFNNAATAVESELASVFKGMGATDQEIKQWRHNLDSSQSPQQMQEGIRTAITLMGSRMEALKSQYETGLGKPKDFQFLNDKSRKILEKLGANPDDLDPVDGGAQAATPSAPAPQFVQMTTPSGKVVRVPADKVKEAISKGGKLVQ